MHPVGGLTCIMDTVVGETRRNKIIGSMFLTVFSGQGGDCAKFLFYFITKIVISTEHKSF